MKLLLAVLLMCGSMAAQEIRRPTVDLDGGAVALGCLPGTNASSTSMPLSYDSAGLATSSTQGRGGSSSAALYSTRVFTAWQSTGNTYSSLTLSVSSAGLGYDSMGGAVGSACLVYSTDSGASWTSIRCDAGPGWLQVTDTITLSATQNLANLRVGVCTQGNKGVSKVELDPGFDEITIWDIWTSGATAAPSGGNGSSAGNAQRGAVIIF
jgi:hypothetical protein